MKPALSVETQRSDDTRRADPHDGDISELIFAFDDDLEAERDSLDIPPRRLRSSISLHSASPTSSASQLGYVMIPYPNNNIQGEGASTSIYTSDTTSTRGQITSKDNRGVVATPSPYSLSPTDYCEQTISQQDLSPSSYLNPTRERPHARTPEPTTPRTRHFRDSMLSLLSLLPPERYSSPSPSVYDEHSQDVDMGEHGPEPCSASPGRPVHVPAAADFPARRRALFLPSAFMPGLPPGQGRSRENLDGTSLRGGETRWGFSRLGGLCTIRGQGGGHSSRQYL